MLYTAQIEYKTANIEVFIEQKVLRRDQGRCDEKRPNACRLPRERWLPIGRHTLDVRRGGSDAIQLA